MLTRRPASARTVALAVAVAAGILAATKETDPTDGRAAWRFEEIADGVFFAAGTGAMTTMSNSMVIVNDDHAMLVDTSVSPAAARKLVAEIRAEATELARLEMALRVREAHWNAIQETKVRPPNVTYRDRMRVVKGGREVQLHFVGRGHTSGDTMVFLPAERIVFTGDFFVGRPGANGLPYMGDGFVNEWPASLDGLKALDFDIIVPGHGTPFRERKQIDDLQGYPRDLWRQASELRAAGHPVEEAVNRVDLSAHARAYGERARRVDPRAVVCIYELLQIRHPL